MSEKPVLFWSARVNLKGVPNLRFSSMGGAEPENFNYGRGAKMALWKIEKIWHIKRLRTDSYGSKLPKYAIKTNPAWKGDEIDSFRRQPWGAGLEIFNYEGAEPEIFNSVGAEHGFHDIRVSFYKSTVLIVELTGWSIHYLTYFNINVWIFINL